MTKETGKDGGVNSPDAPAPSPGAGAIANLSEGVIWNLGSLAFLAIVGFVLNIIIARVYGPEPLGVFNICYSLFIFVSQFSSLGIHFSVLRAVSHHVGRDVAEMNSAAASAVVLTAGIAGAATLASAVATPLVTLVFSRVEGIGLAWLTLAPAIWAFSLNKVLFAVINGARHMRTFAVLQALRYVGMLISLVAFWYFELPPVYLAGIITLTEYTLLPISMLCAGRIVSSWSPNAHWRNIHFQFGLKGFLAGAVAELNTRVDVLVLGALINEGVAGVYSVALLAFEGASQVIVAIRNNLNPRIAQLIRDGEYEKLRQFTRKSIAIVTALMAAVAACAAIAFPLFVDWIMQDNIYMTAYPALLILLGGQAVTAGFTALNMLFIQAGRPAVQSGYMMATLSVNLVGNFALVSAFGMTGAATATTISYLFASAAMLVIARRSLNARLI